MRTVGSGSTWSMRSSSWPRGHVPRAGDVARVVGVVLADVEHDEIAAPRADPVAQLLHRHERDAARGLVEQLRDRLAARPIGA